MKIKSVITLACVFTFAALAPCQSLAQAPAKDSPKVEKKAKGDTYPLYGKVVAVTSRSLTIVRGESEEAKQSKYTLNSATQYVNGEKTATLEDVKVGNWVGGTLQKNAGDGNDIVLKLNVGAKQREAKGKSKPDAPKKKAGTKEAAKETPKKKES